MADTFKKLYQGQLAAAAATLYTAPAAPPTAAIVRSIRIVNTDTVSRWFILYQSGVAAANQITGKIVLGPNETYIDNGPVIVGANDTLRGVAEVAAMLTCTISGVESA